MFSSGSDASVSILPPLNGGTDESKVVPLRRSAAWRR
jgi:hypothetical protein